MSDAPKPYTEAEVIKWPEMGPMNLDMWRMLATVQAAERAEADLRKVAEAAVALAYEEFPHGYDDAFRAALVDRALLASPSPGAGWVSPEVVAEVRQSLMWLRDHGGCGCTAPEEVATVALAKLPKGDAS